MLKINIVEDRGPVNLEPASIKDVMLVAATALAAAGLLSAVVMLIFNLLFSLMSQI